MFKYARPKKPRHLLINAMHTVTGGGLIYLENILPPLVKEAEKKDWCLTLLIPETTLPRLAVPKEIRVETLPLKGFVKGFLYEQFVLPFWCYKRKVNAVLCNAGYVPLLAPKPMPILHTNPDVRFHVAHKGFFSYGGRFYWSCLMFLSRLSLVRAPVAFAVAGHVVPKYATGIFAYFGCKVKVAPPACKEVSKLRHKTVQKVGKTPTVVAVGDVYPQKNFPLLLKAFAILQEKLPKAKLVLVGGVVFQDELARMQEIIDAHDMADAVTLQQSEPRPHAEVLQQVANADVLAAVSTVECFNMPVLEALAIGTPVVAGDTDFQHEVADKAAVYVDLEREGDIPAALAVALYGVLTHEGVRAALHKAGLARAAQFTWDQTAGVIAQEIA